ncbi:MAG TPA: FAD-dependent thymidylate synthase, partial [Candidatus Bathyarchaeia archaeon]|nr:FAD-dependent thymidylate synthase [Candidatus Bathyarchaeia archaeon]
REGFLIARVRLVAHEPDLERVCAAAMRSCYSPHPGYELFTHTSQENVLEGEKVFDAERIGGLLRRALELGHYDILEHNSITWLAEAEEKEILFLMESSKFFETSQIDEKRWLITTNLRVLVELARSANNPPLTKELVATLSDAAPIIGSALESTVVKGRN